MQAALDAGADYVGLVFFPKSPRNVTREVARDLADMARGRALSVALMVDPDDSLVDAVASSVQPDMIQLHGVEAPERAAAIRSRTGIKLIKAVKVAGADDVRAASDYLDAADIVLFDAKPPKIAGALPGGNGLAFDWRALAEAGWSGDFMLSGGLDPSTVREALAITKAPAVDVSSGVERAPGEKDEDLIRRFIKAARSPL